MEIASPPSSLMANVDDADMADGDMIDDSEEDEEAIEVPRESTNKLLPILTSPLIKLIVPTVLSFPPSPADPSPHPPTTSVLSTIHIRALECLNNLFLAIDDSDNSSENGTFTDADRQGASDIWAAIWKALAQVGTIVVDGKISAPRGFEKKREFWEIAMGALWGVARIGKRHLIPNPEQVRIVIEFCTASQDDMIKVKCVGALECLAQYPDGVEANKIIAEHLFKQILSSSPATIESSLQAVSALIDIYSDESVPYDVNFRTNNGIQSLEQILPITRKLLRGIDCRKPGGMDLRRRADEIVTNLIAFIKYPLACRLGYVTPNVHTTSIIMPPRKGIVKSGNAGNSAKSSLSSSKKNASDANLMSEKWLGKTGSDNSEVLCIRITAKLRAEGGHTLQNRHDKGYSFIILLRCRNKRTSQVDIVRFEPRPPFYMPTALEARHWGATYALYRVIIAICNNIQLNRVLPPGPREYWAQLEQEHRAAPEHQTWMYSPDPFAAKKEVEARQLEATKRREESATASQNFVEIREKDSLGGDLVGVIEVKMGPSLRDVVEHAVKQPYVSQNSPGQIKFVPSEAHNDLRQSLRNLSFTPSQIERTLKALSSPSPLTRSLLDASPEPLGAAIAHLLLSTPESDLPPRFLAKGTDDSFIQSAYAGSNNLKIRWVTERLIKEVGFPPHIVKEIIQTKEVSSIGFESLLTELSQRLIGKTCPDEPDQAFDVEERNVDRESEVAALDSIYSSVRVLSSASEEPGTNETRTLVIPIPNTPITFHLILPSNHPYPLTTALPPMYVSDSGASLSPYLRLHLLSSVLRSRLIQDRVSGEGVGLLAVNILEETWDKLQAEGNPDVEEILAPLLGLTHSSADQPTTSDKESKVFVERNTTFIRRDQQKSLKYPENTRTNDQILQEIDETRQRENVLSLFQERQKLPAWSAKDSFLEQFRRHRVVICVGETGSGKTTQVPQYILDDYVDAVRANKTQGLSLAQYQIIVTQPRRVAAVSVASRVSAERGDDGSVSYSIRGESNSTSRTKILFCTTGVALRRLNAGDGFDKVNVIIVDEVHERSVDSDFLLLELRDLLKRNSNIKVVLMSATINHDVFLNYFEGAALVSIPGRTHPVDDIKPAQKQTEKDLQSFRDMYKSQGFDDASVQALENLTRSGRIDYQLIVATVLFIVSNKNDGSVLIFLPGVQEIKKCMDLIKASLGTSVEVLPLHANLTSDEQKKVFKRTAKRKIIISTNVAETSITIDDVVYVIDTGKVKEISYDIDSGLSQLAERWISKAAARQRRGRAGRTQPGECYKLYTRQQHEDWDNFPVPEILRTPLESLLLSAKAMRGNEDVRAFLGKAVDPPPMATIEKTWVVLQELGAINEHNNITALGRLLTLLPVDLRLGKMLVLSIIFNCLEPILTLAACLSSKPLFISPIDKREDATKARLKFMAMNSDLLTDVNAYDECTKVATTGGDSALRKFCEDSFISFTAIKDITTLREDLLEALSSAGFTIESSVSSSMTGSSALLQSIVMAGLHPRIARVTLPSSAIKFDKIQSGTIQRAQEAREFRIFDLDAGTDIDHRGQRVFLHPNSVMFNRDKWKEPFICYFRKTFTTKPYLRDATEVPLYAVLLFGGPLVVNQISGWLTMKRAQGTTPRLSMKAWPRIGVLVNQLKQLLDTRLSEALEIGKLDAFQKGDPVFEAILALLTKGESTFA
ncbi:hypothetical protein Clacol_007464 [Clathrus columnatus]|uniref:ATP-dependent RNA helicase DHX29 n=1 Tax=Clathrus columnatus TaxID=1419009 RepID=A0AAV5AKJ2_9AGAM|nr:hypothetical protein Clacol_007464 [Clathrus columnatus]